MRTQCCPVPEVRCPLAWSAVLRLYSVCLFSTHRDLQGDSWCPTSSSPCQEPSSPQLVIDKGVLGPNRTDLLFPLCTGTSLLSLPTARGYYSFLQTIIGVPLEPRSCSSPLPARTEQPPFRSPRAPAQPFCLLLPSFRFVCVGVMFSC